MAISCLGWGTPFALVNFDKRTAAFRETYAIDAMTFDAFSLRAQRRLRKAVGDAGAMERVATDLFTEVPRRRDQFRETTNQFYQRLAAAVRDGGNTGT